MTPKVAPINPALLTLMIAMGFAGSIEPGQAQERCASLKAGSEQTQAEALRNAVRLLSEYGVLEADPVQEQMRVNQSVLQSLRKKGILEEAAAAGGSDCEGWGG